MDRCRNRQSVDIRKVSGNIDYPDIASRQKFWLVDRTLLERKKGIF